MSDVTLTRSGPDAASGKAGGGLLRLPFALREKAQPDYPAARAVLDYWQQRRGDRIAPARAEIEPTPLAALLRFMFIAEMVAPGVARLRFAGQHLHDILGMEPRGMPLSCLLAAPARDELAGALARVQQGARVQMPLRAARGLGRPGMDGLLALLPLTDGAGRINRVLGVLEAHGQIGRTPRRFELAAEPAPFDAAPEAGTAGASEAGAGEAAAPGPESALRDEIASRAGTASVAPARPAAPARAGAPARPAAPVAGKPAHAARPGWRVIEGGRSG